MLNFYFVFCLVFKSQYQYDNKLQDVLTKFSKGVYDKNSVAKWHVLCTNAFVHYYVFSFQETE